MFVITGLRQTTLGRTLAIRTSWALLFVTMLRMGTAWALGAVVAVLFVGWMGMLPHFGETAPAAFALALLGLWMLGTIIGGRVWNPARR